MSRTDRSRTTPRQPGRSAHSGEVALRSYDVGALPLINHGSRQKRPPIFATCRICERFSMPGSTATIRFSWRPTCSSTASLAIA